MGKTMYFQKPLRQRLRSSLLLIALLLFPITMNYFSPYVIIQGASQGIINGSLIVFVTMFVGSIFLGRLWCSWGCPMGALGEACSHVNNRPVNGKRIDWIKWVIWVPWVALIVFMAIRAGGYRSVDLFLDTEKGISVAGSPDRPIVYAYIIYYLVIALFAILAVIVGRRAGCHTVCWMAPFMILGRKLGNIVHAPALHLVADSEKCSNCMTCTRNCLMSLDVNGMVQMEKMENSECILCGNCIDGCSSKAIHYAFNSKR